MGRVCPWQVKGTALTASETGISIKAQEAESTSLRGFAVVVTPCGVCGGLPGAVVLAIVLMEDRASVILAKAMGRGENRSDQEKYIGWLESSSIRTVLSSRRSSCADAKRR